MSVKKIFAAVLSLTMCFTNFGGVAADENEAGTETTVETTTETTDQGAEDNASVSASGETAETVETVVESVDAAPVDTNADTAATTESTDTASVEESTEAVSGDPVTADTAAETANNTESAATEENTAADTADSASSDETAETSAETDTEITDEQTSEAKAGSELETEDEETEETEETETVTDGAASINGTQYENLTTAYAALNDGETIVLLKDGTDDEIQLPTVNYTLDLNGHSYGGNGFYSVQTNVTITNSSDTAASFNKGILNYGGTLDVEGKITLTSNFFDQGTVTFNNTQADGAVLDYVDWGRKSIAALGSAFTASAIKYTQKQ
ncbi:MAG: hypothetical protein VZT48_00920 [Bulleidia sp.]|nr:hypothetical protein [Bulleidia sp.]